MDSIKRFSTHQSPFALVAEPRIIALAAPSGAGKTTIARRVLKALPALRFSVSATTRPPRPGEEDGVHYHFLSEEVFRARIEAGDLLEYEEVYPGRFYGTLRSEVEQSSRTAPVLLDIDVKGALNVKNQFGDRALLLFIQPPSLQVLAERLRSRATETEESLQTRLARAEMELQAAPHCDAVVTNDDLDAAVAETLAHVRAFVAS